MVARRQLVSSRQPCAKPVSLAQVRKPLRRIPPAEAAFRLVCDPVKEFS